MLKGRRQGRSRWEGKKGRNDAGLRRASVSRSWTGLTGQCRARSGGLAGIGRARGRPALARGCATTTRHLRGANLAGEPARSRSRVPINGSSQTEEAGLHSGRTEPPRCSSRTTDCLAEDRLPCNSRRREVLAFATPEEVAARLNVPTEKRPQVPAGYFATGMRRGAIARQYPAAQAAPRAADIHRERPPDQRHAVRPPASVDPEQKSAAPPKEVARYGD